MRMTPTWNAVAPSMKRVACIVVLSSFAIVVACLSVQQSAPAMPMQARYGDGAEFRWLHKKVLDSRLLDDMDNLVSWSFVGHGEMKLIEVNASRPWSSGPTAGAHVLRIRSITNIAEVEGAGEWEDLVATRKFPAEDWSKFNAFRFGSIPILSGRRLSPVPWCSTTMVLINCPTATTKVGTSRSFSRITHGIRSCGRSHRSIATVSQPSILPTACRRNFLS